MTWAANLQAEIVQLFAEAQRRIDRREVLQEARRHSSYTRADEKARGGHVDKA